MTVNDRGFPAVLARTRTRRGRIAVYRGLDSLDLPWGELNDYDTLDDAQLPADIKGQVDAALGIREVIHRDI